jgi:hypothetical protein
MIFIPKMFSYKKRANEYFDLLFATRVIKKQMKGKNFIFYLFSGHAVREHRLMTSHIETD